MSKHYAIFGAGLSAQAACRLARAKGLSVVLIDEADEGDQATFEASDLERFECFVFSPGFAAEHPWRILAEASGSPCLSEIAFAARYWDGKVIGVTGTNGKSTLTALIDKALSISGHVSVAAGNIGYPFSDAVLSEANQSDAYAVLEISSFQAELADGLLLDSFLWTNFAEDHLDRYGSMPRYYRAKARLFNCQKRDGLCVIGSQVAHWMANQRKAFDGYTIACEVSNLVHQLDADSVFQQFPYSENFSLAAELWRLMDQPSGALIEAANSLALLPHRLKVVAECGSVRFWNDSKATNFHATLAALRSIDRPIVWIGGGRVKGGDVEAFAQQAGPQVEIAVLYGEVAERLAMALRGSLGSVHVYECFDHAIAAAAEFAAKIPHANVLLSPGFSSYDQFDSFDARGKNFNDTVLSLKNARKPN
jgi:UDP-N-acetylmuramoylalanine--D-glutamate ligase